MASLRVKDQGNGPVIYGRWRDGSKHVERPIGRGWLVRDGAPGAKPNGRTIGSWRERRGVPPAEYFSVLRAMQELANVKAAWRVEREAEEERRRRAAVAPSNLRALADRYLDWGSKDDPHTDREGWKHSHAVNTRTYVNRVVRELGPERAIDEVTAEELRRFMRELMPLRNGKPTGAAPTRKFLSNYAQPLKRMFAMAHREGWIAEDPAADVPTYKPKRKRAADPMRREEYLTPEEVVAVVANLAVEQDRAIVLAMAMAGLRPGEAVALRWQDVDLATSTLRVVQSHTLGVTGTPKSGIGRSLPIPPEVAKALATVGLRSVMTAPADLVFISRNGGHVDVTKLRERFNAAQDAADIRPRRELRQLRNTFGTVMAAAGAPLRTIQAWMGHENIVTTERYASHMPRDRDAALVSAAFAVEPKPASDEHAQAA